MHTRLSRWWNGISLRTKITGITVLLVALGLLVAGLGTMTVLNTYLVGQLDNSVKTTATSPTLRVQPSANGSCQLNVAVENTTYIGIYKQDGSVVCHTSGSHRPDLSGIDLQTHVQAAQAFGVWDSSRSREWRAYAVTVGTSDETTTSTPVTYIMVVAFSTDSANATIARFTFIFLGFGVSVILLGAMLTRLLVTATFDPLRDVEDTAARFAAGDYSQRLEDDTPNTEVGRLNASLNQMLERIDLAFDDRQRTIEQMRRFVGDASHELRTPLVSLRGYAELYRMGALQNEEDVAQAMERIEKEAQRMGLLVQDLLQLARIDESKPLDLGPVDLVAIARDSALDTMASNPDREIQVLLTNAVTGESVRQQVSRSAGGSGGVAGSGRGFVGAGSGGRGDAGGVGGGGVDSGWGAVEGLPADGGVGGIGGRPGSPSTNVTGPIAFAGQTIARLRARRNRAMNVPTASESDTPTTPLPAVVLPARPPVVLAEENKIRQVVTNLMGNAMRFTEHDAPIEIGIGVDEERDMAHLDVIDHGEGIPPQLREKIFQRFWRADTSRARDTGGSGLGLAIVSGIVAAHGGSVEVLDTPGGGATFRVWLPLLPRA